jgi:uncharacterized membrane protein
MTVVPVVFAALAFRGWFPVWAAVMLGLLATGAAIALYYRESATIPVWRRGLLATIRILILISIIFLALRPTIVREIQRQRPRPVIVLLDNSQSMTLRDPRPAAVDRIRAAIALDRIAPESRLPSPPSSGDIPELPEPLPSRLELLQGILKNSRLRLLGKLNEIGPVQVATFGRRRVVVNSEQSDWQKVLTGSEPQTAFVDVIFELFNRDANELPAAIVLCSDGRDNSSSRSLDDLAREAARLNVPLHIYGVGSSSFGQLQIRDVAVNETLFVDDTAIVPVRFRVRGFTEGKAILVAKLNGVEVARKVLTLSDGENLQEKLTFVPTPRDAEAGIQELTTILEAVSGKDNARDQLTKSVRILDRKIKVLSVDSSPRWDFKFLQRALLRDRRVEARFFLTEGDIRAMNSGPPFIPEFPTSRQALFQYDLLILGDVPASAFSREQQEFIRDFVAEGGGLIAIAGPQHAPASWVGTPLAETLPVEVPVVAFPIDSGNRPEGYRPVMTPIGMRSPLLSLVDSPEENHHVWQTLPELYWAYPVMKLKPAAEVYLTHPREQTSDRKPMPLLAGHYFGKGYVLYLGLNETWRWRYNEADRYFGRFWTQAVYLTGVPRTLGNKLTQLSLDTPDPLLGRTGQVYARLFTPELKPLTTDRIEARIERLDGQQSDSERSSSVELKAVPGQPGEYVATIPFNAVGRYALRVDAGTGPASLEYRVALPPEHELSAGGMAEDALQDLALRSGGSFYHEEDLHTLPQKIEPKSSPFRRREELLLWNHWLLLWIIGLFSAEWFLRKLNSLS